jgi:16S rRNA (guanine966-N2)-methyltransferase
MKIIGGEAKGRKLFIPKAATVRPTAERIKAAFFNIIQPLNGESFLDLFAGTGNMGLEALSRGAVRSTFIENNQVLVHAMTRNIAACGFTDRSEILSSDFIHAVLKLKERSDSFDILFADPPYERGFVSQILEHLGSGALMAKEGLLGIQHSIREAIKDNKSGQLVLVDQRQYGDTILSFFRISNSEFCIHRLFQTKVYNKLKKIH